MSVLPLRLEPDVRVESPRAPILMSQPWPGRLPVGEILISAGDLTPANRDRALQLQRYAGGRKLGEILVAEGFVAPDRLETALAVQRGAAQVDPIEALPDVRLIDQLGPERCLQWGVLPWREAGGAVVVATARPERFEARRAALEDIFGPVLMALTDEARIGEAVVLFRAGQLVQAAECRTAEAESCRPMQGGDFAYGLLLWGTVVTALAVAVPGLVVAAFTGFAVVMLLAMTVLRVAATVSELIARVRLARRFTSRRAGPEPELRPVVSLLIPLLREGQISAELIGRIGALDYPDHLLDICFVVEEGDAETRAALSAGDLRPNMRRIVVPPGTIRTKPRALNYALDFARGSIVGIYDAEDAPAPDQISKVVAGFAAAPPEVACLQGRLDFYNARTNWLTRCFAVDYATWFRVILPGLSRLGFAIPLGGTTLFFRRNALEEMGRWDAHNVTEDADLGIRLARRGFRAELLDTVTEEEAVSKARPWVRQRARWLKGYALTYAVHMRDPVALWRQLGTKRFLGFQVMFLGTVSLFLLAPLLWSFWLLPLGLPHPLAQVMPPVALTTLIAFFIASELSNLAAQFLAVSGPKHRWLAVWVPTLHLYYPLAALAAWRALADIIVRPFFWDKTEHGVSRPRGPRQP